MKPSFVSSFRRSLGKAKRKLKENLAGNSEDMFPLCPPLPLPEGVSEGQLFQFLQSVLVSDAPPQEMANYCTQDFRRFVYTYGLARNLSGQALELGANPYFTTFLLREFSPLQLTLANYFGSELDSLVSQSVNFRDFKTEKHNRVELKSYHFNIEQEKFPFQESQFDVVFFCEIIEHLLLDPVAVLREIKRILKPDGALILTTPNVSRLENVAKMIAGANIYDPYSGYGPYGRHNREYNKHELYLLLTYLGFEIETLFSADVHQNNAGNYIALSKLKPVLQAREQDLGQYLFVKAINSQPGHSKKPSFLYRSYPPEELE
ncbi:class I SAM-dependent methyltransferase [Oscillatoria sp. FACHB-1406]|uniref:class I SAM-dependent methyltransferase n=1 Tax=Oscillatoria sp. FACHB-1406 TaxID=2692846 RepID=UPI0016843350|nr:class I SAM-dependent methyltransferase [Oscillatoria sp. FACHB-1406]MBD2577181.1 methyltransferase domain-containing protein [Oscillatoria sp. FACHB-1406]